MCHVCHVFHELLLLLFLRQRPWRWWGYGCRWWRCRRWLLHHLLLMRQSRLLVRLLLHAILLHHAGVLLHHTRLLLLLHHASLLLVHHTRLLGLLHHTSVLRLLSLHFQPLAWTAQFLLTMCIGALFSTWAEALVVIIV